MNTFLKRWRKENLNKEHIGKYLLYALGEILLITIGVLIAVNINERQANKQHSALRCQYLEELNYVFEYDIKDVEENILGFNMWNPKMIEVVNAIRNKQLGELDSLHEKLGTIPNFIFWGERSKTKMEELKNSNIDLIGNRKLKNKILLYQDEHIMYLKGIERRYNLVDEQIRQYYAKNFLGYAYEKAVPHSLENLQKDKEFLALTWQKLGFNSRLKNTYERILKEQIGIKVIIEKEIAKNCDLENQNN